MFNFLFDYNQSPINLIIKALGFKDSLIHFISADYSVNFSLAYVVIWRNIGFYIVLYLAGLQSIEPELYDAAKIDGAAFGHVVLHIILPNIKRIIEITLFLSLSTSLQIFYEPFLITNGGPAGRSHTFVTKIVDVAFRFSNFGRASAMGVILLILVTVLIVLQNTILKKGSQYND